MEIIHRSRELARQDWYDMLEPKNVLRLVANYRPDQPQCEMVGRTEGRFYIAMQIAFTDGFHWVVRVPKPGSCLYPEETIRQEVAVMKYVQFHTNIPVPKVIAFGFGDENVGGFGPFMITEFVEGVNLGALLFDANVDQDFEESIHRQLATFLLDLSHCTFFEAGSLVMESDQGNLTWSIGGRPLTMSLNEIRRTTGADLLDPCQRYIPGVTSNTQFFRQIVEQRAHHFYQQNDSIGSPQGATREYNRRHLVFKIINDVVPDELKNGPFGLVCDDFSPDNMIVRDGKIVAVLDWKWTYAGPIELSLSAPRWLYKEFPAVWDRNQQAGYSAKFDKFLKIFAEQERRMFPSDHLIMYNWMKEEWRQSGKFDYRELVNKVACFDGGWLWQRLVKHYATDFNQTEVFPDIERIQAVEYKAYLDLTSPIGTLDHITSSTDSNRCSFCWACLNPDWMSHDLSECIQLPFQNSTVSMAEVLKQTPAQFTYLLNIDVDPACGVPYYFGCTNSRCLYPGTVYAVYVAAIGRANFLHPEAQTALYKHYGFTLSQVMPHNLSKILSRPYKVGSKYITALIWYVQLIHDNAPLDFRRSSQ